MPGMAPPIVPLTNVASPAITAFCVIAHIFRMTLFFLVAGFFGRMLLEKRGTRGFVRNRVTRILLPLVAFWPPLILSLVMVGGWGAIVAPPENASPPPPPISAANFPLAHLWFLYILLIFYIGALLMRAVPGSDRVAALFDKAVRWATRTRAATVLLALPAFVILSNMADWAPVSGIPAPLAGPIPDIAAVAIYGVAFGFGWLVERQRNLLECWRSDWAAHMLFAIALTILFEWPLGAPDMPVADQGQRILLAAVYALAVWAWTIGLAGLALRFLSGYHPAIRYIADSSYWVYLVHLPLVMALQVAVYPMAAPAIVKYACVLLAAMSLLLASYELLVRHSWLGVWLNGRRYPWRFPGMKPRTLEKA